MPIDWNIVDDDDDARPVPSEPAGTLDARRIHAIVLERRAAHRARLRRVIVPIACAAVAAMAMAGVLRPGAKPMSGVIACAAIAAAAIWIGVRAARRHGVDPIVDPKRYLSTPSFDELPHARADAERLADLNR